jgi:uncharacterized protein
MNEIIFKKTINEILENLDFSKLKENVAIKVHFGENGCKTYIKPEIVKAVYEKVISLNKKASLVECNVLYKGERTKASSHIELAKQHGFNFAPIDILDGEDGNEFIEINGCKIGKGIEKYDSMIVITHFKGHVMAGFGGAMKNLGMGLGSRAGKLHMHSTIKPSINNKCTACGLCIQHCNANAITLKKNLFNQTKAKIDSEKCEGCAMCIAICPNNAIAIPWKSETPKGLQEKITDYCLAISKKLNQNIIFINVLENITKDCDCVGQPQKTIMQDIGILAGYDIVSIDKASLDLANKQGFDKMIKVDKNHQIEYAEKIALGTKEYTLKN